MTTVQGLQLSRQAAGALQLLSEAQYQLLVIRSRQLDEANRETTVFRDEILSVERITDDLIDQIEALCKANALGLHGTPAEQLARIGSLLDTYTDKFLSMDSELSTLRAELAKEGEVVP